MDRAVLDTDILSELMRGQNAQVVSHATAYRQQFGRLTISTLSILEVVKGFAKAGREPRIAGFLKFTASHELLTLDATAA